MVDIGIVYADKYTTIYPFMKESDIVKLLLPSTTRLIVLDEFLDWYRVRTPDKMIGYVKKEDVIPESFQRYTMVADRVISCLNGRKGFEVGFWSQLDEYM